MNKPPQQLARELAEKCVDGIYEEIASISHEKLTALILRELNLEQLIRAEQQNKTLVEAHKQLIADKERLDWLERANFSEAELFRRELQKHLVNETGNIRQAIDSAMSAQGKES